MRFGLTAFCTDRSLDPGSLAAAVEAAGFDLLLFPDHTHIPVARRSPFPGGELPDHYARAHDPVVACAFAAAATSSLRIGIGVCLVPARDPIVLAKQVAGLDVLSGGRMALGVGAGWNAEEIADHGVDPRRRWAVLRDRVGAMKAIWSDEVASFRSEHASFGPMWSWPKPQQRPHPPILVGGHGPGVLARVVDYGDEWLAMVARGAPPLSERMATLRDLADAAGRRPPTVAVQVYGHPPDDAVIERYLSAGVGRIDLSLPHGPPAETVAAIGRLAETVARFSGG